MDGQTALKQCKLQRQSHVITILLCSVNLENKVLDVFQSRCQVSARQGTADLFTYLLLLSHLTKSLSASFSLTMLLQLHISSNGRMAVGNRLRGSVHRKVLRVKRVLITTRNCFKFLLNHTNLYMPKQTLLLTNILIRCLMSFKCVIRCLPKTFNSILPRWTSQRIARYKPKLTG
jgi:hypothetical protein